MKINLVAASIMWPLTLCGWMLACDGGDSDTSSSADDDGSAQNDDDSSDDDSSDDDSSDDDTGADDTDQDDTTEDDAGSDSGPDDTDRDDSDAGGTEDPGPTETLCPEEQPTEGDPCPRFGLSCSYGEAQLPGCRTIWGCRGSTDLIWRVSEPDADCDTAEEDCPATKPDLDDEPTSRKVCAYDDVLCVFGAIATQACLCDSPGWYCSDLDDACPESVPNDGTACHDDGLECAYIPEYCPAGTESESFSVKCDDGVWKWSRSQCLQ